MTTDTLLGLMQGLILLMAGIGVRGVFAIRDQLRLLNGRVGVLEERQRGHERLDDDRFKRLWGGRLRDEV